MPSDAISCGAGGARAAALARARGSVGFRSPRPPLVRQPPRRRDARDPARARRDRGRRAPRRTAGLGPRRALVPGHGDGAASRGRAPARRAALPGARRQPGEGCVAGAPRCERRADRRPRDAPVALRSPDPRSAIAPRRCSASATGSRCTCRRRSASTATTSYRCSWATGSWAAPSRASTAGQGVLDVLGAWGDTSRLAEALAGLAAFLGADHVSACETPGGCRG